MDHNESKKLFAQVRVAHRLLAAYYQKIQHLIEEVRSHDELGLEFYTWTPVLFDSPVRRTSNQLERCAWDLLPGINTEYVFLHGDGNFQKIGDWLLAFYVISDTGVEDWESAKNPLEIVIPPEDGDSILGCYVFAPRKSLTVNWHHDIWCVIDLPEPTEDEEPMVQCVHEENEIYGCGFEIPMDQLTAEGAGEMLVERIKLFRDAVISCGISALVQ